MADLYLDNDVSQRLVPLLEEAGHHCTTAVELGLDAAGDEVQLLTATQRHAALLTYNRRDFMLLHRAWHLWAPALGADLPPHAGILALDQAELLDQSTALLALLGSIASQVIRDRLLWWHPPAGWRTLEDAEWRSVNL